MTVAASSRSTSACPSLDSWHHVPCLSLAGSLWGGFLPAGEAAAEGSWRGPKDLASPVWTRGGWDVKACCQRARADVMMDVLLLVQGQVIFLQVVSLLLLLVLVTEEFVVEVQGVLLFSLSSTPNPRTTPSTRPAGRCLGLGR